MTVLTSFFPMPFDISRIFLLSSKFPEHTGFQPSNEKQFDRDALRRNVL